MFRTRHFDIIHVHMPVAAWIGRWAAHLYQPGATIIYTVHGFRFYRGAPLLTNAVFRTLEKVAGRWTDYLITINEEDLQAAKQYRIVDPGRVRYMPGIGVDTARYDPSRIDQGAVSDLWQSLQLDEDSVVFLMMAEFIERKRHKDALLALGQLNDRRVHLAFAGDGRLQGRMEAFARRLGVAERTHFLGFRSDIPVLIKAAQATLLPSAGEGLPRSVLESLALEVPVIGTDIRGTRELLQGGCGILVPVGDVPALVEAMRWVVQFPDQATAMGREGRRKVQGGYDLANALKAQQAIYCEAWVSERGARSDGHRA
jgi:glycosyltransferase involved in cell wall biosynthesis